MLKIAVSGCPRTDDRALARPAALLRAGLLSVTVFFRGAVPLVYENVEAIASGGWFLVLSRPDGADYLVTETVAELALAVQG